MRLGKAVAKLVALERVCHVATVGRAGVPHCVPVCHVLAGRRLLFASARDGRKALNLGENPRVAVTVDLYSEEWTRLRGVMIQGRARLIRRGPRFARARALLYAKYLQYRREAALGVADSVVVEVTPTRVFAWGFERRT